MPIALTRADVEALHPCEDNFCRVSDILGDWQTPVDAATARDAGCTFGDVMWVAVRMARRDPDVARRMRLFAADCAAHVLHIYEAFDTSNAPRRAIEVARRHARGEASDGELSDAWAGAHAAARAVSRAAAWGARSAWAARSAETAACGAAETAAETAAWGGAWAAWVARAAEIEWQFDRLVERLSNDEPDDWPLPERKETA